MIGATEPRVTRVAKGDTAEAPETAAAAVPGGGGGGSREGEARFRAKHRHPVTLFVTPNEREYKAKPKRVTEVTLILLPLYPPIGGGVPGRSARGASPLSPPAASGPAREAVSGPGQDKPSSAGR